MSEKDGFEELIGEFAREMENAALEHVASSAFKAARLCGLVVKEAKEWGVPKDLAEAMAADVWQIIMIPTGTEVVEAGE
ncbi:hypothetical protein DWB77_02082 [Streptomyces hundungensis]|uniref:Uncharacterized protein n=1 Tax=Streptomyces hundungensis TaxID=1077946 RepID=A0A387HCH4_9ACTN|nr:hypothetical protein [Streptomyces hundungensis]AYG79963.1 hypothetical protein DWB77_02082 [Streptomyces hundungensis]